MQFMRRDNKRGKESRYFPDQEDYGKKRTTARKSLLGPDRHETSEEAQQPSASSRSIFQLARDGLEAHKQSKHTSLQVDDDDDILSLDSESEGGDEFGEEQAPDDFALSTSKEFSTSKNGIQNAFDFPHPQEEKTLEQEDLFAGMTNDTTPPDLAISSTTKTSTEDGLFETHKNHISDMVSVAPSVDSTVHVEHGYQLNFENGGIQVSKLESMLGKIEEDEAPSAPEDATMNGLPPPSVMGGTFSSTKADPTDGVSVAPSVDSHSTMHVEHGFQLAFDGGGGVRVSKLGDETSAALEKVEEDDDDDDDDENPLDIQDSIQEAPPPPPPAHAASAYKSALPKTNEQADEGNFQWQRVETPRKEPSTMKELPVETAKKEENAKVAEQSSKPSRSRTRRSRSFDESNLEVGASGGHSRSSRPSRRRSTRKEDGGRSRRSSTTTEKSQDGDKDSQSPASLRRSRRPSTENGSTDRQSPASLRRQRRPSNEGEVGKSSGQSPASLRRSRRSTSTTEKQGDGTRDGHSPASLRRSRVSSSEKTGQGVNTRSPHQRTKKTFSRADADEGVVMPPPEARTRPESSRGKVAQRARSQLGNGSSHAGSGNSKPRANSQSRRSKSVPRQRRRQVSTEKQAVTFDAERDSNEQNHSSKTQRRRPGGVTKRPSNEQIDDQMARGDKEETTDPQSNGDDVAPTMSSSPGSSAQRRKELRKTSVRRTRPSLASESRPSSRMVRKGTSRRTIQADDESPKSSEAPRRGLNDAGEGTTGRSSGVFSPRMQRAASVRVGGFAGASVVEANLLSPAGDIAGRRGLRRIASARHSQEPAAQLEPSIPSLSPVASSPRTPADNKSGLRNNTPGFDSFIQDLRTDLTKDEGLPLSSPEGNGNKGQPKKSRGFFQKMKNISLARSGTAKLS